MTEQLSPLQTWWNGVVAEFDLNFIQKDRWRSLVTGLGNTLQITAIALCIGIVIGVLVAAVRATWDTSISESPKSFGRSLMGVLNSVCKLYTTVIRGTPMVIQLLILYYVVFASSSNGLMVAALSFGINSGAYVSEIIRGGIMAVDKGQMEAGYSLGMNYTQTMWYVIAPQVFKSSLPTLANEFIVLLKETSVAGYAAVHDLTYAGNRIRGVTYSAFMPLIAVALIYLVLVVGLTKLVSIMEKRLRQSDGR